MNCLKLILCKFSLLIDFFFKPWLDVEKDPPESLKSNPGGCYINKNNSQKVNVNNFYPVTQAGIAIFTFITIVAIGAGIARLKTYYAFYGVLFSVLDLSIHELIDYSTILIYGKPDNESKDYKILFYLFLCIFITVMACKPLWNEKRINLFIISFVPICWFLFGGKVNGIQEMNAKIDFLSEITYIDSRFRRIVGDTRNNSLGKGSITSKLLKEKCFYLIAQDKKNLYVLLDPLTLKSLDDYYLKYKTVSKTEEQCVERLVNDDFSCQDNDYRCKNKLFSDEMKKIINKKNEQFAKSILVKTQYESDLIEVSSLIITAQIPIDTLNSLYTLPVGDYLEKDENEKCNNLRLDNRLY